MNLGVVLLALMTIGTLSGQPSLRLRGSRPPVTAIRGGSHYILVFHSMPTSQTLRDLAARGIRVLQYVPDTGLLVTMPASADLEGFDFAYTTALEVSDKLAPQLHTSSSKYFLLIFHADVEAARTREIAQSAGFDILNNAGLLPNQVLAAGPYSGLETLAGNDEVSYVMPASSELVSGAPVVGCPGGVTGGGSIGEYAVGGKGWSKDFGGVAALKYVIENLTSKMDANMARGEIERALREWTRYASLRFSAAERADTARAIAIRFAVGNHGDGYPFDGVRMVLGHAFYPSPVTSEPLAGDIHLDADEDWQMGSGVDLYSVVLHEMGHALGLGHSSQPGAVMYPYYRQAAGLASEDIARIQGLYGTPQQPVAEGPALQPGQPVAPAAPVEAAAPAAKDTVAPVVRIAGSTMLTTRAALIILTGTATDNVGVTAVKFTVAGGTAGTAQGTVNWTANVPLIIGANAIVMRAFDAAGNSSWRSITVVRL